MTTTLSPLPPCASAAAGAVSLSAQTAQAPAAKAPVAAHRAATTAASRRRCACSKTSPCFRRRFRRCLPARLRQAALHHHHTSPVKLDYVSPLEGPELRETLGLESSTFSLDYVDTKVGTGPLAAPHKWYTIHYTGYLIDGTKFDSSLDRGEPISIHLRRAHGHPRLGHRL